MLTNDDKKQAFFYCFPSDPYFQFILLRVLQKNIRIFPDADHIIYPIYGIRVYSSLASKYPKALKKAFSFVRYIAQERRLYLQKKRLIQTYITPSEFGKIRFVKPHQWVVSLISSRHKIEALKKYKDISVNSFIHQFRFDRAPAGDLLIDTYLRYKGVAVADLNHWFFKDIAWRGFAIELIHRKILSKHKNIMLFGSYTSYIDHGIGIRLFCNNQQKAITFGSRRTPYQIHENLLSNQLPRHEGYHEHIFPQDAQNLSKKVLLKAEESLTNRCNHNYDNSMNYMQRAFIKSGSGYQKNDIPDNILLMLHDFLDSVHGYRWVVFPDFYQWADETISFCVRNNIGINVKPHPNQRPESQLFIEELQAKYSSFKVVRWIDKSASNNELFTLNPSLLITVYGSVVAEAAFQGIKVLLAGDYPGINFDIGKVATNRDVYFRCVSSPALVDNPKRSHAILYNAILFKNSFEKNFCSLYEFLGIKNIGVSNLKELMLSSEAKNHLDKILSKLYGDLFC